MAAFGIYVHVPYCAARCGYCDFNTYVAGSAEHARFAAAAIAELNLAARELPDPARPVSTVFFGGGTPTLLPAADLLAILRAIDSGFGLAAGAEVTVEANPESIDARGLEALRAGGVTRMSFGMQSAAAHVLTMLDRRHTPGRAAAAVGEAWRAGFEHVSVDLIYGTPAETDADWRASLEAALAAGPDHISAYALTIEPGTRLAAQVRRGDLPAPDEDALADRYAIADERLGQAGLSWYEISNWARPGAECRHNLGYWRGADWWGVGPGAHSHVDGVRRWNVLRPADYAARLAAGRSPEAGHEVLDPAARAFEDTMLRVRLAEGVPASDRVRRLAEDGLFEMAGDRARLTVRGRLLADLVVRELTRETAMMAA